MFSQIFKYEISESLDRFWRSECVPETFTDSLPEHLHCERLFEDTTLLKDNKFQVTVPLMPPLSDVNIVVGNSFNLALCRFLNLEKRFQKDKSLFAEYKKFIDQYIALNHGVYYDINSYNMSEHPVYFLPHHPVIKQDNKTTKSTVVFDGSMKTDKKVSLNDLMLNGVL